MRRPLTGADEPREEDEMMKNVNRRLTPVSWTNVQFERGFWAERRATNRRVTLPLEYRLMRKTGAIGAHQWDWWDPAKGRAPWRIWVGDLGKLVEATAYSLATDPDRALAARMEHVVRSVIKGQKPDGYLYPNPLPKSWRFRNLQEYHELYELGHDIEGAVAHYQVTGKRHFLDAVCRAADFADSRLGRGPGKLRGYDGHPEIELALVKLYRVTGERRYLAFAKYLVDERGQRPLYFDREQEEARRLHLPMMGWYQRNYFYCQAHKPLREQRDAVGHAVRALYLYAGATDVAIETGDVGLLAACRRLWQSITRRRMYITGGVGSTSQGEAFTYDYDLPNETAYAETCANIALVFFAHRMLQVEADAEYADVMERALYNGVLSGISLDGRKFFYANHLAVHPTGTVEGHGQVSDAVALTRQGWFGCACCPPNIARLLASLGGYACSTAPGALYVHLYGFGRVETRVDGQKVVLRQTTNYPWGESVRLAVDVPPARPFTLAVRLPGWCRAPAVHVNGRVWNGPIQKGYALITRQWRRADRVDLAFPMPIERIEAHPGVRMDCGKVALQRGPVVYCLEEVDNGPRLADLCLPRATRLKAEYRSSLLGGCVVIRGKMVRRETAGWDNALYRPARSRTKTVPFTAVPYCLWANRKPGEMRVWVRGE